MSFQVMHFGFNYFLFNMALADLMIALFNVGTTWTFNCKSQITAISNFSFSLLRLVVRVPLHSHDVLWYSSYYRIRLLNDVPKLGSVSKTKVSPSNVDLCRCQAVVNPLRKRPLSRKRSLHAITFIWVLSAVTALPLTVVAKVDEVWFYNIKWDRSQCSPSSSSNLLVQVSSVVFAARTRLPTCPSPCKSVLLLPIHPPPG